MTPHPAIGYAFPVRALRRWAAERLRVEYAPDRSIDASFRFEGSTCGNIPFTMIYRVRLSAAGGDGWRIEAFDCAPAPFDAGHRQQCASRENAARLAVVVGAAPPLEGVLLQRAIEWDPPCSPEGCLCSATSRNHKWLAVLETLHFFLDQSKPPTEP